MAVLYSMMIFADSVDWIRERRLPGKAYARSGNQSCNRGLKIVMLIAGGSYAKERFSEVNL